MEENNFGKKEKESKRIEDRGSKETGKCKMVEDLLPLYTEGMCSEETKGYVEEHLASCDTCKGKLECYQEQVEQMITADQPDEKRTLEEIRPMRKINRKIRKKRFINVLLSVILILLLGATALLSYGQLVPGSGVPSFELLFERVHIQAICKEMCSGSPEVLAKHMDYSLYQNTSLLGTGDTKPYFQSIQEMMEKAFKDNFDRKTMKIIGMETYYVNESMWDEIEQYYVCTDVEIEVDGETLLFTFDKLGNGIYRINCVSESNESQFDDFMKIFNYAKGDSRVFQQWLLGTWASSVYRAALKGEEDSEKKRTELFAGSFAMDSMKQSERTKEYQEALISRLYELRQEGICIMDCYGKAAKFDEEDGREKQQLLFVFERLETGEKITLMQDFFCGPLGYQPAGDGKVLGCQEAEEIQNKIQTVFSGA